MARTLACILLSVTLYVVTFGFLVHKPISIGVMHDLYRAKIDYAAAIDRPKIVVSAGSSGLYGIRCELIEINLGIPCANMSLNLQMGMTGILEFARRAARPGDVVLLPLEYGVYAGGGYGSTLRQYAIAYDRDLLFALPPERQVWSMFYFDLKWLGAALSETWAYFARGERLHLQQPGALTPQGDLRGHNFAKGERFAGEVRRQPPGSIYLEDVNRDAKALPILRDFLDWARRRNILVVGALPPNVDTGELDEARLKLIRDTYLDAGHTFAEIENRGLYPVECFYDSSQHLNEACQAAHTRAVTRALVAQWALPASVTPMQQSSASVPLDRW
jgi:hypothetical protein